MSRWLPLGLFLALGVVLAWALFRPDRDVLTSALLDDPVPAFEAPLLDGEGTLSAADLRSDGVTVLNFWASWCPPCVVEHPKLMQLAALDGVRVVGIATADDAEDSRAFLEKHGDPFALVGRDPRRRINVEFGVAALPETFVIGPDGTIRYKHTGPINPGELEERILPAIEAARAD